MFDKLSKDEKKRLRQMVEQRITLTWSSLQPAGWQELVEWTRIMLAHLAEVELVEVEV